MYKKIYRIIEKEKAKPIDRAGVSLFPCYW